MPIVVREHALRANNRVAKLTEVLNLLVLMLEAVHLATAALRHGLRLLAPIDVLQIIHALVSG